MDVQLFRHQSLKRQSLPLAPLQWNNGLCTWEPISECMSSFCLYAYLFNGLLNIPGDQFHRSVVSDSSWPHGLQHTRLPCPPPSPRVCSNSCTLSWWYHPTILSSVVPFSSCLRSFPASGSFLVSQFFTSGGQSIGASASASVLPMNRIDWFDLLTGQGTLKSFLQHHNSKIDCKCDR